MERLTYWNEEYGCWSYHGPSGEAAKRLAAYEDTGLEPEEILSAVDMAKIACALHELNAYKELGSIDCLRKLAQADREGRIVLRSAGAGKKCGSCGHWHRINDTRRGTCDVRRWLRDRYGASDPGAIFTPPQSYRACREYVRGESSATE